MKNNIEYYQHFTNSYRHLKFRVLREKYGWAGEGRFWALNDLIAEAENCIIDLNKKNMKKFIALELELSVKEFEEYLDYLFNECELVELENGFLTTEIVQENLERVNKERLKARARKQKFAEPVKSSPSVPRTSQKFAELSKSSPELLTNKMKDKDKGNEIKVNETEEKPDSQKPKPNYPPGYEEERARRYEYVYKPPEVNDVILFFEGNESDKPQALKFFNHFSSQNWVTKNGIKITNWQAKALLWITDNKGYENGKQQLSADRKQRGYIDEARVKRELLEGYGISEETGEVPF